LIYLNKILKREKMSIYRLEKLTNIDRTYLTKIARGERKSISLKTLKKITKALNCTFQDLIQEGANED
jgi:DNA-binding Xre family transcriptional regulator